MIFGGLRRWRPRQADSAAHRNEIVDRGRELTPLLGANGVLVNGTPLGTMISMRQGGQVSGGRLGKIVDEGPEEADDYTDARYWVKFSNIDGQGDLLPGGEIGENIVSPIPPKDDKQRDAFPSATCVTNLFEVGGKSHCLPVDGTQLVWCWPYRDTYGQVHWLMDHPVTVWLKIASDASGGGKYNARTVGGPTGALAATGNLSEADCGETSNGTTVLAFNVREVGLATHDIDNSGFLPLLFIGKYVGRTSDGTPVYIFDGLQWEDCA